MNEKEMLESLFESCAPVLEADGTVKNAKVKNFSDTFLYNKGSYKNALFEYIMHADRVDKKDPSLDKLRMDLKTQKTSNTLLKVFDSANTVLCIAEKAMPRAFKVMVAKDVKEGGSLKVFIDLTGIVSKVNGEYTYNIQDFNNIVAYLMGGMHSLIYYSAPSKVINKNELMTSACKCFTSLVYYVTDYMGATRDASNKGKLMYYYAKYFHKCLLDMDDTESLENRSKRIAGIADTEVAVVDLILEKVKDPYKDLNSFTQGIAAITRKDDFKVDPLVEKWMWCLGTGTQFGLELYTSFANILIYTYVNSYLFNKKTVEKIVGRDLVDYMHSMLSMAEEVLK